MFTPPVGFHFRVEVLGLAPVAGDLTPNFFLDGTGANGVKIDVQQQVEKFQAVPGYNGDIHRPNDLLVAWGTIQSAELPWLAGERPR